MGVVVDDDEVQPVRLRGRKERKQDEAEGAASEDDSAAGEQDAG